MSRAHLQWGLVGLLGLVGLFLVYSINPTESQRFPKCPFYRFTDLHCPGCGTTRATHQFLHGNVLRGLAYNPILSIVVPLLGLLCWEQLGRARGWHVWPVARWISSWIVWAIVIYWVARNVPFMPFTLLAPH